MLIIVSQRQTVVSQFFQLDRLVVEGQKSVGHIFQEAVDIRSSP